MFNQLKRFFVSLFKTKNRKARSAEFGIGLDENGFIEIVEL